MQQPTAATDGAVRLARLHSFHVGGRRVRVTGQPTVALRLSADMPDFTHAASGDYLVDQAYVQCFEPEDRRHALPVLLIHGGGLTGAIWEATAAGGPGWVTRLLQAGFAVNVIDNVERGRAGWCALPGENPGQPISRSDQEAWALYRLGRAEDYGSRTPFAGQQFPVQHLDRLSRHHVPRWTTSDAATEAALLEALRRIGPSVLVGHSQGGRFAFTTAFRHPELVPACLAVEPAGVPPPPAGDAVRGQGFAVLYGDFVAHSPFWAGLAAGAADAMRTLAGRGAQAEFLSLPAMGIPGSSHMPMLDNNSDQVVAAVAAWIGQLERTGRLGTPAAEGGRG